MRIRAGSYETEIDDETFTLFGDIKWRAVKSSISGKPYVYHPDHGMLSRLIMQTPKGMDCDHINGDTLDNRKENLRNSTKSQNLVNQPKYVGKSSRFKGVSWYPNYGKWRARISYEYKTILLGYFDVEEDAARAYNTKALELYGEFAVLNETGGNSERATD